MKKLTNLLLLLVVLFANGMNAQTKVQIGDLYYNLSGASASVTYWFTSTGSGYSNKSYTVPSSVSYAGTLFSVESIGDRAFAGRDNTVDGCTAYSITLPNTVESIGKGAFDSCSRLSNIELGGTKTIADYAFSECGKLAVVDLNNTNDIGRYVFNKCKSLVNVDLRKVKSIGDNAFQSCSSLLSIIIPSTVLSIGNNPFADCNLLREIFYLPRKAPVGWVAAGATYVPDKKEYSTPSNSMNSAKIVEMITFNETEMDYSGQAPNVTWTCNVIGYTASLDIPTLSGETGKHEVWIPATFTKDGKSFSAEVVYRYVVKPVKIFAKLSNASRMYGEENPQFAISYSGFVNNEDESVIITKPVVTTTATQISNVGIYPITISGGEARNYTFEYISGILTITKAPISAKVNDVSRQYGEENPIFDIEYVGLKNGETVPEWTTAPTIQTAATKSSDVGDYTIKANGAVAKNYDLAIADGKLTVTQAPLTITATNASRQYFDDEPAFEYSCTGFRNGDDKQALTKEPAIVTEATKTSAVGIYKITPSSAKAKNYAISYEQGELTITKRELKATSHSSRLYGEENPTLPIEYTGFVNNETEDVLTTKPVGTTTATKTSPVGTYPITVSGGEATNYAFTYEQGELTVSKAGLTAKVKDATKVYGDDNPSFDIEYVGLKNGETAPEWTTAPTIQTAATKTSDVGDYAIKANDAVAKNYDLAIADGKLSITQAPLTITATNASRQYFDGEPAFEYSCTGFRNGDDKQALTKEPAIVTEATKTSAVGTYKITPSSAEAKNYAISYEQGELTITKRELKATSHSSRLYGEENPTLPIEYTGFVNSETEDVLTTKPVGTTTATKTSPVGTYPITVSGGEATNYAFTYEQGELTVNKAGLTAKVKDATKVYGDENPSFDIEYVGLKNGETAPEWTTAPTIQTAATKTSDVGDYAIKANDAVAKNYDLAIADGKLTVTQAPLTITATNASRQYFDDEPVFGYSCTGFRNGDDKQALTKEPAIVTEATKTSVVGTYKITPSSAEAKNYAISYEQGELTITKRELKATSHCSRLYGEENPTLPIEYTGFVNSETEDVLTTKPVGTTTATKTSPVGKYPITVSGGEATNYAFTYEQGELTVTKAGLTAKVKDATKVYGDENPSFDIEYVGLKNGETAPEWTTAPAFQTAASKTSDVGDYAIKANDGVAKNYDLAIADGKLTITPAPLTIKANDMARLYYSENPSLDYTCNGFVNGDDKSTLSVKPNLSTLATLTSNVGDYDIEASGAVNPNYSISYEKGKLSVTPRTLTASVGNYERIYNEDNPAFEVTYAGFVGNEDESVITTKAVATTTATKTSDAGTYPIEVSGGGATNYVFSYNSGTLTINKAEQTISWEQDLTGLKAGEQIELKAESTSGLPVTYQMESNNVAEVYAAGTKWYLDCKADGEVQIVAVQEGNQNYYSSARIRKKIVVGDISGIRAAKSDHHNNIPTYDTMGRKVQELKKGQLYIRQGKKFVVK